MSARHQPDEQGNELKPLKSADLPKEIEEVLQLVPQDKRAKAGALMITMTKAMSYQGSVPHPDIIAGYESILPGSARELLDMAKEQSTHRMSIEKRAIAEQLSQLKWDRHMHLL